MILKGGLNTIWNYQRINGFTFLSADHVSQVPQLACLIFSVADDIPSVALRVDVRQAFCVAKEHARRTHRSQRPPIPNFERCVV